MYLNPNWNILTVGDGDLSFSNALYRHIKPKKLVASTYDEQSTIEQKYPDNALNALKSQQVEVLNSFDVTNPKCWQTLGQHLHSFDVVIFQFPLIPAFVGRDAFEHNTRHTSMNVLNRALLHQFIKYANELALNPQGAGLCFITSKDVKPYREWNIESNLNTHLNAQYQGRMPFDISHFSGYKIRNVDRDKHVKDTSGITYVFSENPLPELASLLTLPAYLTDNYCSLCRVGPFLADEDKSKHFAAKKHLQMVKLEQDWQQWLTAFYKTT
ncbi:class I SAM-dependent methyltransferase [Pseudoalteromonas sp. SIMBA_153]